MSNLRKLKTGAVPKWVSPSFLRNPFQPINFPHFPTGSLPPGCQNPRFYRTKKNIPAESLNHGKVSAAVLRKAQSAFADYLHSTRSLQYGAAESIGKNSPLFLGKLLEKVALDDIERSLARFLRYHPINEFEPFFESIGLLPSEYTSLLPRDMMFLEESHWLLTNYLVLSNYGIEPCKIGRIYKDMREIFEHDHGVLLEKIRAYENRGISQLCIVKAVLCSPYLLTGNLKTEFIDVLERFKVLGFEQDWIEAQLCEGACHIWSQILELLCSFTRLGITDEQLSVLIRRNPGILFEDSGCTTFALIGMLFKFGLRGDALLSVFVEFPQISVENFFLNLRQCFVFLTDIAMKSADIGGIIQSEALLLGSSNLKKANSMLANLNVGKRRLREIVKQNPKEMCNWVMGRRVSRVFGPKEEEVSMLEKRKFVLSLGLVNESTNMEKALKSFRGKGYDLQERFDCIVKAGLDKNDVREMVRVSPHILNQTKDVIAMKIDFLVNDIGYPVTSLKRFPSYLSFKTERIKVRLLMFRWLSDNGVADPLLALSTIIACSDGAFEKYYVKRHPDGLKVWHDLREKFVVNRSVSTVSGLVIDESSLGGQN